MESSVYHSAGKVPAESDCSFVSPARKTLRQWLPQRAQSAYSPWSALNFLKTSPTSYFKHLWRSLPRDPPLHGVCFLKSLHTSTLLSSCQSAALTHTPCCHRALTVCSQRLRRFGWKLVLTGHLVSFKRRFDHRPQLLLTLTARRVGGMERCSASPTVASRMFTVGFSVNVLY